MFKWKDAFSVNVAEIDKQHKKLIEIGSKLAHILSLKDDIDHYDEIMEILENLKEYTVYHFNYEEELMKKYGFEGLKAHEREHQAFVDKIIELTTKDIDDNQKKVTMDMLIFIADWIENHILKTDHKYKDFFNEKGIF
ncbi:hemerythrin [Caminicella sporogenes DSM 14501]|uniref:Hemerythrin n=1 Tax=Caminicella sporogenes DSM 14501 TaxID=1121266 RepID=A0A1M6PAT8_9FIRM|nr:bacteriohemerythrin [Caminicella sporogenes]RKD21470.1 bacteriohemerythrin [Caminicella sporogenes]SHK05081.1 hemerythrin [Caminicella sporogenes DSM 14501]